MTNAAQSRPDESAKNTVHKVELLISYILRIGVIASLSIVVLGTIITFVHHPSILEAQDLISPEAKFPHTLAEVWRGTRELRGQAIVVAGLLLLIATPVIRVAVSVLAFVYQKDWTFVAITCVVLALLLLSFFVGV